METTLPKVQQASLLDSYHTVGFQHLSMVPQHRGQCMALLSPAVPACSGFSLLHLVVGRIFP